MSERICSIPDCGRPLLYKGWCTKHYARAQRRNGDPLAQIPGGPGTAVAYFREHRYDQVEGCKIWPLGLTTAGYAQIRIDRISSYVHVLACTDRWGPAPFPNMDAAHGPCHNRACWNGGHLSWKTRKDNLADMERDGTARKGEKASMAKLTAEDVLAIRARATGTSSYPVLADEYGVSRHNISMIVRRTRWTHI